MWQQQVLSFEQLARSCAAAAVVSKLTSADSSCPDAIMVKKPGAFSIMQDVCHSCTAPIFGLMLWWQQMIRTRRESFLDANDVGIARKTMWGCFW